MPADHMRELVLVSEQVHEEDLNWLLDPDLIDTLSRVVDAEWKLMGPVFEGQPASTVQAARTVVAKYALHLVSRGHVDVGTLCDKLHRAMQHTYPALRDRPDICFQIAPC